MEVMISGIGGIANFSHALSYFLLGCGTVQVCTAAIAWSPVRSEDFTMAVLS